MFASALAACTFQLDGTSVGGDLGTRSDLSGMRVDGAPRDQGMPTDRGVRGDQAMPVDLTGTPMDLTSTADLSIVCPGGAPPHNVGDFTEGDATRWSPSSANPATNGTTSADTQMKTFGTQSIRLDTQSTFSSVLYPKGKNAGWNLTGYTTMHIDIASDNTQGWQGNQPTVYLIQDGNTYFQYTPSQNQISGTGFTSVDIPLAGGGTWSRTQHGGTASLATINYLAIDVNANRAPYKLWLDHVTFTPGSFPDCSP